MAGMFKKENLFSSPCTDDHGHLDRLLFIQMGWKVSENKHSCVEVENKTYHWHFFDTILCIPG